MTVFKSFLKILNRNKVLILIYTIILISFGSLNMQTNENNTNFIANKPDIAIINNDKETGITKNLIDYLSKNSNIKTIKDDNDALNDALFYRDINYIVYIPKNYHNDFINGKDPEIKIKSTGDYQASLAEMLLTRYINVAKTYQKNINEETKLINKIDETLNKKVSATLTTKLDTNSLSKATSYYNFANYSILACLVYIICLILSSYRDVKIQKRTVISSVNYKKYNKELLLSNVLFSLVLCLIYIILSFILLGKVMLGIHGLFYAANLLIFTLVGTTIAFFIGNLVLNKNALNGIVNVIALGSSFLCGAFVPINWLPDKILTIAHLLPSYYYINTNETIKTIETFNLETVKSIIINTSILLIFALIFIVLTNIVARRKRVLN